MIQLNIDLDHIYYPRQYWAMGIGEHPAIQAAKLDYFVKLWILQEYYGEMNVPICCFRDWPKNYKQAIHL